METLELLLDKVKLENCLNLTKVLIENSEEILNVNSTIYPNLSKENYKNFRFDEIQNGYIYFQLKNSQIFDLKFEFFELYILIYNNENELALSFDFNEVNKISLQNFIDFCKKMDTEFILRGLRNPADFEFERAIAHTNRDLGGVETIFLLTAVKTSHISSSIVRDVIRNRGDYTLLVPESVRIENIENYYIH